MVPVSPPEPDTVTVGPLAPDTVPDGRNPPDMVPVDRTARDMVRAGRLVPKIHRILAQGFHIPEREPRRTLAPKLRIRTSAW